MYPEERSVEEKKKIRMLRERVSTLLHPDFESDNYLAKWLIARRYDVDKAEEMLKKHINFMKVNGIDKVTEEYNPPEATQYFFTTHLGYDKDGSLVRLLHVGASDLRGLVLSISKLDSLKYAAYVIYNDIMRQKKDRANDTLCEKQVYIIDLQGLSWRHIIQRMVAERAYVLLKNYEANHPENLKVAYIVNVPSFFSFIFNWLKTVLPDSIISKLEIVSQEDCQSVLTKTIDPSILPASIGGTRRDPDGDPTCRSLYPKPLGNPVPEEFLLTNQLAVLVNDPEAQTVTVDNRSSLILEKVITEPNSVLQWDFQTNDYDIRMGLHFKPNDQSESEQIIPVHRVESHIIPESGSFHCDKAGIYEIVFDNTYSWMTSKEVTYKIKVVLAKDNSDQDL